MTFLAEKGELKEKSLKRGVTALKRKSDVQLLATVLFSQFPNFLRQLCRIECVYASGYDDLFLRGERLHGSVYPY